MSFLRGLIALIAFGLAASAQAPSAGDRAAVVNGEAISLEQVTRLAAADLEKLDKQRAGHEDTYVMDRLRVLHAALNALIADKLIETEAAKQSMTKERLIEIEIDSNVEVPSDPEVADFYEANKARIPIPRAEALPQVKQYLVDQSRKRYRDMLVRGLTRQYPVNVLLEPIREKIAIAGHPSQGPANAPITLVEFADFECPHCGALFPTLKAIESAYADKLRVVYRQFPMTTIHPHAQKAAEASLCANEQRRFWEYHDLLFRDQPHLEIEDLKARAATLGLDRDAFAKCLDSGAQAAAVKKDIEEAASVGVTGTPAVFINGRVLSGNQPMAVIRDLIEDELRRQASGK